VSKPHWRKLSEMPPVGAGCVRVITSDNQVHDIVARLMPEALEIDPDLRTIPGPNPNMLVLTAEDVVWLWTCGVIEIPGDQ
jgi:hypothetical protein